MRLPYEKFLLYLVITKHTDNEIINLANSYLLPKLGNVYISQLKKYLLGEFVDLDAFLTEQSDPILYKFRRDGIKERWLVKFDLLEAHTGDSDFDKAYSIFSNQKKREMLNIYCLCPDLPQDQIAELFEEKFGESIPDEAINIYKKYFFDIEILSQKDWLDYIKKLDSKTRVLYEAAPTRKSKYVRWKMGDEVHLDPADVSSVIMTDFFFLSQDAHMSKENDWVDRSVKLAGMALSASDRAAKNKKVINKNMKSDLLMLLEEEPDIPSFMELDVEDE